MALKNKDILLYEADLIRRAVEESFNTAERVGKLFVDVIEEFSKSEYAAVKGFQIISSVDELPENPTREQLMIGYLLGTKMYVYVGDYGDTLEGKYLGIELKGDKGDKGDKGESGVSLGEVALVDDLTTGGSESALTAEMGKQLKGLINDVDEMLEPYSVEDMEVLPLISRTGGQLVNTNTSRAQNGGGGAYANDLYAVTPGDVLQLEFAAGNTAAISGSFDAFGFGFFASTPSGGTSAVAMVESNGSPLKLKDSPSASPLRVTVPAGASHLGCTVWVSVTNSVVVKKVTNGLDIATTSELEDIEERVEAVESAAGIVGDVTETAESVAIESDMAAARTKYMAAPYIGNICRLRTTGSGGTWVAGWEVSAGQRYRVKFKRTDGTQWDAFTAIAFFTAPPSTDMMEGITALKVVGDTSSYVKFGDFRDSDASFDVEVPLGYTWMAVSSYYGKDATVHKIGLSAIDLVARNAIEYMSIPEPEWSVPDKLYAIVGVEKRVYIDCILKDFGYYVVSVHGDSSNSITVTDYSDAKKANPDPSKPSDYYTKLVACINGGYLYFRAITAGETEITLDVYDPHGRFSGSKTLTFVAIEKTLPSRPMNVCMFGDSITEVYNMAAFVRHKFDVLFPNAVNLPNFVGSKRHAYFNPYIDVDWNTRYEGWWGKYYRWLDGEIGSGSPLVHNGAIDITHWRTADGTFSDNPSDTTYSHSAGCGLGANEFVDVVSFALGSNQTITADDRNKELEALKTIIKAFHDENANTVFIVHLNTLLGRGGGVDMWMGKLLTIYEWRKLVLTNLLNDPNLDGFKIIIGDLGCCYDRFYAYRHSSVEAAPQYPTEMVERITMNTGDEGDRIGSYAALDIQHPSKSGEQQLGESIVPVVLKAMQMCDK